MVSEETRLPPLPEIGQADAFYSHLITQAEAQRDVHLKAATKVGRYITLAINPKLPWAEKLRYFSHALRHHCVSPSREPEVQQFYAQLAEMIRQHCGAEALRLASQEDDMYAARAALGQDRTGIEDDAEAFFLQLMGRGDRCPEYFNEIDFAQLKLLRDQWI